MSSPLDRILAETNAARAKKRSAKRAMMKRRVQYDHWGISVGELEERANELSMDEAETLA